MLISAVIFIFLIIAVSFFLYWLITSMNIILPNFINDFFQYGISLIGSGFIDSDLYKNITMLLPLVVSIIFILLTYISNCILLYVEQSHKKFQKYVTDYKNNLEKTINQQLKRNFINELTKTNFFVTKMKIEVKTLNSYLHTPLPEEECRKLEATILTSIFKAMNQSYIIKKELEQDGIYFICADMRLSSEFYAEFVSKAVTYINKYMLDKVSINFYCSVDVFDNECEEKLKLAEMDKILALKVRNKILVSPRFKVYFQELYPGYFIFKLLGEYNFSETTYKSQYVNIYTLHRNV